MSMDVSTRSAHHGFDVAPHVANLGVFGSFHLHERASGQPRQAPRNFRFTHAGWTDHQNILWQDIFGHFRLQLLSPYAVAQGHGHGSLRRCLPHDVFVQFHHDFPRRHVVQRRQQRRIFRPARAISAREQGYFFFWLSLPYTFKSLHARGDASTARPSSLSLNDLLPNEMSSPCQKSSHECFLGGRSFSSDIKLPDKTGFSP